MGEISAQVFPAPKVELSSLIIGGEKGLYVKRLFIDSSFSELAAGELAISNITVEAPAAHIVKLPDGSMEIGSWKFLKKSTQTRQQNSASPSDEGPAKKKAVAINISKLSITSGNLEYLEPERDLKLGISNIDLKLTDFSPDRSAPITFGFSLFGKSSANVLGQGSFIANSFQTKTPIIDLTIRLGPIELSELAPVLTKFSPKPQSITAKGELTGQLHATGKESGVNLNLELDGSSAAINYADKEGAVLVNKVVGTPLRVSAKGNLSPAKVLNLEEFDLKLNNSIISGSSTIDLENKAQSVKRLNLALQKVSVSDLNQFINVPAITAGDFSGTLQLDMSKKPLPEMDGTIDISQASFDKLSIQQLKGKLNFQKNLISSDALELNYKGEDMKLSGDLLRYSGNRFDTPKLNIFTSGGTLLLQNTFLNEGEKPFSGSINGNGIDLHRLMGIISNLPSYTLNGTISKFASTFKGTSANIKQDLSADFSIDIEKGEIIGINLIGAVFQKIGVIPGLSESLLQFVPEKYKPLVTAVNSTAFDSLAIDGNLNSGSEINLAKANLIHSAYLILGSGRASTKGTLDLKTQMKITKAITEGMAVRNAKLQLLLDKEGNLTFPLLISKADGPVVVLPDVTELGKNALRNSAKDAASKALNKLSPGLGTGASQLLNKIF